MATISGAGPTPATFPFSTGHSAIGRMTALVLGPDGNRMYAGSFAGMWRSDDSGRNWFQLTRPQPPFGVALGDIPGALFAPHIFDVAVSPTDANLVLVSALDSQFSDGRDGIYRSTDGGVSWTLVLKTTVQCNIVFAPDNPKLVYAAMGFQVGRSHDGGATWAVQSLFYAWHIAVGPLEANGVRRVYAAGYSTISYSSDGGNTWTTDAGVSTILDKRQALNDLRKTFNPDDGGIGGFAGPISYAVGTAGQTLAIEPGNPAKVYLATEGAANGPSFYAPADSVPDGTLCNTPCPDGTPNPACVRFVGEASLWLGEFSQFNPANPAAEWTSLPGPPVYFGTTTPSGNTYVVTKPTNSGFLLFFSDNSHVHVSAGPPTATTSWHRMDGEDASAARQVGRKGNLVFMHPDPHAIAFTSDFEITLAPATGTVDSPYDRNSVLSQFIAGTIWMANDGGVYWSEDGGAQGENSWNLPLGLETLDPVNIAGLCGLGDKPALYFGSGDNDDFFSRDGGSTWQDPRSNCGDCDAWFADTAQVDRVIQFLPRKDPGVIGVIVSSDPTQYPKASDGASKRFIPSTRKVVVTDPIAHTKKLVPYASSGVVLRGYRPVIKTLATEAPLPDGDYVFIDQALDTEMSTLLRTTSIFSITQLSDWADPTKATPIGPFLPPGADIVQVSGGHSTPVYYVGDASGNVWKLDATQTTWNQVVPYKSVLGTAVFSALRWFVDPYDPDLIYVLDFQGVKVSPDGGQTWIFDLGMTITVTAGSKLRISASIMQDMLFFRGERQTRFSFGTAGVCCTMDFGATWFSVLSSIALPGRPESGFFDPLSDPTDRALYVECEGRSILRVGGLPELPPFQPPPPPFDLMEFAALDY
jgi:BNR/Asp-box repeat.